MSGLVVVRRLYPLGGPWGTGEGWTVVEYTASGARAPLHTHRTEALAWVALRGERMGRTGREVSIVG